MKNLLTTTTLAAGLALSPMHHAVAAEPGSDKLERWCKQDSSTMTICVIGGLAVAAIVLAVAEAASTNRPTASRSHSAADDSGTIIGGNASPENHTPDPTPEYTLPEIEPQYDVNEQGLAWGSRADGTAH